MNKTYKSVLIGIIIAAIVGIIAYRQVMRGHDDMAKAKPDITIKAEELIKLYEEDEKNADNLFLGKILEIKGVVSLIESTDEEATITMEVDGYMGGIAFELTNPEEADELNEEEYHVLKGKCSGKLTDVVISRSVVVE